MLSAPVMVALLLTQFVMGLISQAVPTVNIFIVSFPLTIGIGPCRAFPAGVVHYSRAELSRLDKWRRGKETGEVQPADATVIRGPVELKQTERFLTTQLDDAANGAKWASGRARQAPRSRAVRSES